MFDRKSMLYLDRNLLANSRVISVKVKSIFFFVQLSFGEKLDITLYNIISYTSYPFLPTFCSPYSFFSAKKLLSFLSGDSHLSIPLKGQRWS